MKLNKINKFILISFLIFNINFYIYFYTCYINFEKINNNNKKNNYINLNINEATKLIFLSGFKNSGINLLKIILSKNLNNFYCPLSINGINIFLNTLHIQFFNKIERNRLIEAKLSLDNLIISYRKLLYNLFPKKFNFIVCSHNK